LDARLCALAAKLVFKAKESKTLVEIIGGVEAGLVCPLGQIRVAPGSGTCAAQLNQPVQEHDDSDR